MVLSMEWHRAVATTALRIGVVTMMLSSVAMAFTVLVLVYTSDTNGGRAGAIGGPLGSESIVYNVNAKLLVHHHRRPGAVDASADAVAAAAADVDVADGQQTRPKPMRTHTRTAGTVAAPTAVRTTKTTTAVTATTTAATAMTSAEPAATAVNISASAAASADGGDPIYIDESTVAPLSTVLPSGAAAEAIASAGTERITSIEYFDQIIADHRARQRQHHQQQPQQQHPKQQHRLHRQNEQEARPAARGDVISGNDDDDEGDDDDGDGDYEETDNRVHRVVGKRRERLRKEWIRQQQQQQGAPKLAINTERGDDGKRDGGTPSKFDEVLMSMLK